MRDARTSKQKLDRDNYKIKDDYFTFRLPYI